MRMTCSWIGVIAPILMVPSCAVWAAPQRITVPAHLEYCVTSKGVSISAYERPEVREALFQQLYKQIEKAALEAGLSSIGVVFVDAVTPESVAPVASAIPVTDQQSEIRYFVRQCAIVPARGTPPLASSGFKEVPARIVYATLCAPASIDACRRELEKLVRQENASPAELARPIIWRTRPALTSEDSTANLVASMSDSILLKLTDSQPPLVVPKDLVVHSAELKSPNQ